MDVQRFEQIERLFHAAQELPAQDRDQFVQREAGDDPALCSEVRRLLSAEAAEGRSELVEALLALGAPPAARLQVPGAGQWLGPYRLVRELGRGGTGVVYEAEEADSHRRVAVKVYPAAAPERAEALLREAQILARLDHPAIARVYAAGYMESGQPYIVMELVEGQRVDKYVRRRPRGERLELFLRICDAVEYAHRQHVIHCDLKPSNVLVRGEPGGPEWSADGGGSAAVVKVLDFGMARLVDPDVTWTALVGASAGWGTLPYMSREQRRGGALDRRSDVYSLGVILFKLMTDELPYPVEGLPLHEAWYRIENEAPRRPGKLDPALRGDLETIILNAIADEPAERYQTAAELSADVRRYLSDLRPARRAPGVAREAWRFAKRNRGLVGVLAVTFVGLLTTVLGVYGGYARAMATLSTTERLAHGRETIEQDYLAIEAAAIDEFRAKGLQRRWQPELAAAFNSLDKAAQNLRSLGPPDEVAKVLAALVDEAKRELPPGHWYTAALEGVQGECLTGLRRFPQAERHLLNSYEALKAVVGESHEATSLAATRMLALYREWGRPDKYNEWSRRVPAYIARPPASQPWLTSELKRQSWLP